MATKTAAVVPAKGIGDALIMMIASQRLREEGYSVTTFHPFMHQLADWFPGHRFEKKFIPSHYDLVIVENDNSPKVKDLKKIYPEQLSIFYPTYCASKHLPLSLKDQVFDPTKPMADNVSIAMDNLLGNCTASKYNGWAPPLYLVHKKHPQRIVIHPMSSQREKNWSKEKFLKLASLLEKRGFEAVFAMSPEERKEWKEAPDFSSLDAVAAFIYESGYAIGNDSMVGHLASCFNIPTLIISDDKTRMQLWRPGWLKGEVITPSSWIPNCKFLRLRRKRWQRWVSVKKALALFDQFTASL